jgi:hypothetical protein
MTKLAITKKQAEKMTAAVHEKWRSMETSWADLGRMVSECLDKEVPKALGLNAEAWMDRAIPGSKTKAWRALRSYRALKGVPKAKVEQLSEGNAVALSKLPEKERKSSKWVDKAIETPNEQFTEEVAVHVAEKSGVKRDPFVILKISLPLPIFKKWEESFEKMARIFDIDISHFEGRKILVYEHIAEMIDALQDDTIKNMVVGGDGTEEKPE